MRIQPERPIKIYIQPISLSVNHYMNRSDIMYTFKCKPNLALFFCHCFNLVYQDCIFYTKTVNFVQMLYILCHKCIYVSSVGLTETALAVRSCTRWYVPCPCLEQAVWGGAYVRLPMIWLWHKSFLQYLSWFNPYIKSHKGPPGRFWLH